MPPTQIRGEQILDGSIKSADIDDSLELEFAKVRVSSEDSAPGWLSSKITPGANVSVTVIGVSGSDQSVQISATGGIASPAGAEGELQFNGSGSLSASSNLFYDSATFTLNIVSASIEDMRALSGVTVGTGGSEDLEMMYFADVGFAGSSLWPDGMGVPLSSGAQEWDEFYQIFGEMSVLGAITSAKNNRHVSGSLVVDGGLAVGYQSFSSDFTVTNMMHFCAVNTSTVSVTASLSPASTFSAGQVIIIKDTARNASANEIRVVAPAGDLIDGDSFVRMNTSSASLTLVADGSSNWFITQRV